MAERSNIEWCDSTWNPWIGCTKISPACDHCYAERNFDHRLHVVQWGAGQARKRTGDDNWKKPGKWNAKPFYECEVCGLRTDNPMRAQCNGPHRSQHMWKPARRRVFCASLADWLDNEVPVEWLVDLLDLIRSTPNLDWLLLSKRIGNWRKRIDAVIREIDGDDPCELKSWLLAWIDDSTPRNVWLGATICNQAEADRDIPKLLAVPATVHFLSIEPMLGPINLEKPMPGPDLDQGGGQMICRPWLIQSGIDWVICGGESGPHARPMHPQWARDLRDQCAAAGVPFLFKQWGEWSPGGIHVPIGTRAIRCEHSGAVHSWPPASEPDSGDWCMHRVGKKAAGRLLDGRTHDAFPKGGA